MTRDHIIPKSLGGTDVVENLRPACEVCNGVRGNSLTPEEVQFRKDNQHLVSQTRLNVGKKNAKKALEVETCATTRERITESFRMIGEEL